MWQSADPILDDYLDGNRGMGGVYNSLNLGLYTYAHQSPVKLTDPDGNAPYNPWNPREAFNPHNINDAGPRGPDAGYGPGMRANGMPDRGRSYDNRSWKQIQADDLRVYEARQRSQQLKANREKGAEFEKNSIEKMKTDPARKEVVEQVTIKTESGVKTRVDIMSRDAKTGAIQCTECKSSSTAPLTRNQKAAYPEIEKSGGVIVGKGKPGFPGGTEIPPTKVEIIRPTQSE